VYIEAVDFLPGLAGESRNFDANGPYIRILGALGQTGVSSLQSGLVGGTLAPLAGFEPQVPPGGHSPPLMPNVPCETQPPITDLSSNSTPAPSPVTGSTLPSALGLIPLPLGLASDGKSTGTNRSQPASPAEIAAARQKLQKQGVFEIVNPPRQAAAARAAKTTHTTKSGRGNQKSRAGKSTKSGKSTR
jgi:hypothetical protein